jgi:hypothetical protein
MAKSAYPNFPNMAPRWHRPKVSRTRKKNLLNKTRSNPYDAILIGDQQTGDVTVGERMAEYLSWVARREPKIYMSLGRLILRKSVD